jgi:hypothetical protein
MEDEQGRVWVGVHFGSRGFGHKTASGFLALAQGLPFDGRATEGEMDSPPVLLEVGTELGEAYISAMELAGEYAYAGRDVVVAKVLEILGADAVHEVHNHHNFAWREEHLGRTYWVIRKGCTPARPGQEGFVGGSMGDESVILEGVESSRGRGVAVLDRARRRPGDEPHAGGGQGPPAQAPVEAQHVLARLGDQPRAPGVVGQHLLEDLAQRGRVARREAQPDGAVAGDDLAQAAGVGDDAQAARRHRLERDDPERLVDRRHDAQVGDAVERVQHVVADPAQERAVALQSPGAAPGA